MVVQVTCGSERGPIGRLARLDGLRGMLAVYVMLGHTAPFLPLPPLAGRVVEALVSHGLAAVDVFFALSGLVIVQSLARFEGRAGPFLAARAWRLLPVYFVALALSILILAGPAPFPLMPWVHPGNVEFQVWEGALPSHFGAHLLAHLTLAQGLLPRHALPDAAFSLLGPAWSLSVEWQFYAVIVVLIGRVGTWRNGLPRLVVLFLALAVAARVYAVLAPETWQFTRAFLPNQAAYFALGIATARLWHGGGMRLFGATVAIAMLLGASHTHGLAMLGKALPPLVWAVAVAAQRVPQYRAIRPVARILGHPAVLWLGAISYPLYLLNEPVARGGALLIGRLTNGDPVWFTLLWTPLVLAVPVAGGALLHYGLEVRFTRAARLRPVPQVPVPAARPS